MLKYVAKAKPGKKLPTTDRKSTNGYEKSRNDIVSDEEDLEDGSDDEMTEDVDPKEAGSDDEEANLDEDKINKRFVLYSKD
ncbi:hypothetical protein DPMN_059958 [Dreissena polymorpha]|uniref:Uncharacterized protein n=1 Tax=Dreissena polymorpha TaxID=45954 RepID=A0A9D4C516_DREPO|nr:hypothetical protein DPMN_059958 [Dreissena polymorpha]